MILNDGISNLYKEFSNMVNEAILNNEFEVIKVTQHTIDIKCCGKECSIWNVEEQTTHLQRVDIDFFNSLTTSSVCHSEFKKEKTCRKIIRKKASLEESKLLDKEMEALLERKQNLIKG